jgi:Prohead core protein serine protease
MQLIREAFEEVKILTEDVEGRKNHYIEGIFMQDSCKNRNGRIYPKEVLKPEVERYIREFVDRDRAIGELGHPDTPTINQERASHKIISLREDGNNYIGKARIMATPMGKIVKTLLDENVKFGVSSRGLGTLKMTEGCNIVQPDYFLATPADIVHDPSAPDAFVNGLMEHREWVWQNGNIVEADLSQMEAEIKRTKKNRLEETMIKMFADYLAKL